MSEEKTIEPDVKQEADTQVENNVQDAIPRSRLNEVISQKKELETKLNEMKSMVEEKQRAELEDKREKFSSLPTDSLLDVVEELSSAKSNPQNNVGTVSRKDVDFKSISKEERRDNWSSILNNFKR